MIIIVIFILISTLAFLLKKDFTYKKPLFFICGLFLILIAGFRSSNYTDYGGYVDYFNERDTLFVEPAFILISKIIHIFSTNAIYLFIVFAILGVSLKLIAIKQLTALWLLSLVIYISYFFILHDMIQIRVGVASAFLLLCIKPIYDKNWKLFLLFSITAILFHYSALLILPLYFLSKKPNRIWLSLFIPLGYLIYFTQINIIDLLPIPGFQDKLAIYKQLQEEGNDHWNAINVFNLLFLIRIIIYYFILWKYELITSFNKYTPVIIKIYAISLFCFLIFAKMPVFAFRINELFGVVEIILIPLLFYTVKPKTVSKAMILFIGLNFILILLFHDKIIPL